MRTIELPISKSIANRLLMLGYTFPEHGLPDDVLVLQRALQAVQQGETHIDIGNCGTAMRFLTAYCANKDGCEVILDGCERMHERPMGALVDALRTAGADIKYLGETGFPPLYIHGKTLSQEPIHLTITESSQFVSALLLAGLQVETEDTSPYIEMTQSLMEAHTKGESITMERDWSAAAFWYEYVALYGGEILLPDLYFQTLQGDSYVAEIFESFGVQTEETDTGMRIWKDAGHRILDTILHVNFADCPDLYPAVYVTCHTLGITLKAKGTERLIHKESNRIQAFDQLKSFALGPSVRILNSFHDHRIAMALIVAGYTVDDMDCISKSYPQFVEQIQNITFVIPYREECVSLNLSPSGGNKKGAALFVSDKGNGKKWALEQGIRQAKTEYVWLSDIDVQREVWPIFVPPTLVADLTILPLRMAGVGLQQIEYQAIQGLTLYTAHKHRPVMCSGANMIVNREKWLSSIADLHPDIPSGDDMFLLESFKRKGYSIHALRNPQYVATISPEPTWKAFLKQRMRWAGKAPKYTDKDILLCGVITVLANIFVLLIWPFKLYWDWKMIRWGDVAPPPQTINRKQAFGYAILLEFIYPIYMFICLIGGLIRQKQW